jgi:hypothetical protein
VAASLGALALALMGVALVVAGGAAIYLGIRNPGSAVMTGIALTFAAPLALRLWSWLEMRDWATIDKLRGRMADPGGATDGVPA